jgi:FRG domain
MRGTPGCILADYIPELLDQVRDFDEEIRRRGSIVWYRGHCVADWQLTSSLHRHVERMTGRLFSPPDHVELLRDDFKTLYRTFKNEAWPLLNQAERTEWGVIFAMQHHGFPTRLLDWTESFVCALFFAQHGRARGDAAVVWGLDPEALNETSIQKSGIVSIDDIVTSTDVNTNMWHPRFVAPTVQVPTIAVAPTFSNPRMTAQRSRFTLMGDSFKPLNKQFNGQLFRDRSLIRMEIPDSCYDEVQTFLRTAGLGAFTFMPDLEGLRHEHEQRNLAKLSDAERFMPSEFKPK